MSTNPSDSYLRSPWVVCTETCGVYCSPDLTSHCLTTLPLGSRIYVEHISTADGLEWIPIHYEEIQGYALRCFFYRVYPKNIQPGNLRIGLERVNRWWGVPLAYEPSDLVEIPREWCFEDRGDFLRSEPLQKALELLEGARSVGIELRICSAYRSGERQRILYLAALARDGCNQRYSAPPGHSEHQLGTALDFVDPEGKHLLKDSFGESEAGRWLADHAQQFGFRRSYTPENVQETGYISEPWHYRYWGPSSAWPI